MRLTISLALVTGSLALAACGGSSSPDEQENTSPAVARKEIGATRDALQKALATYKSGDRKAAQEQVAEAYVAHFEAAEGPLAKRSDALKENLERAIATELRHAMRAARPAARVEAQVQAIVAALDKAQAALQ